IRVNAIAPGLVETELALRTFNLLSGEQIEQLRKMHPLGFGTVEDIASIIAFVASDEAKWMTGAILTIDGGCSAK
ncbi:TPA: SDR family oxidoreductase, partial [Candidatus Poribacteria bacterium]|nr:SDR family oxidoreductase [Candidatus Poribacteria bacterium]